MRLLRKIALFTFALVIGCGSHLVADEPLEKYLEGLKNRGYFDIAYEYLDVSTKSGAIPNSLRERIDFEKAVVLIEGISELRDRKEINQNLDLSQALLDKFIKEKKFHPFASIAKKQLGNLLIQRAQISVNKSNDKKTDQEDVESLRAQARDYYEKATEVLEISREDIKEALTRIDSKSKDPTIVALRDRYRAEFLRVRILLPLIEEETAGTFAENSDKRKELLEKAILLYDDYSKDYRSKLIGIRAQLYQARCHTKLGQNDKAAILINEILDLENSPAFLSIKRDASLLGAKAWFATDPPSYRMAIERMKPLVDSVPPNSQKLPEWLEVKLYLAKAYNLYAKQLKSKEDISDKERKELQISRNQALELARAVARIPSPIRVDAQKLLVEIGSRSNIAKEEVKPPKSFVEARDRATTVLADYDSDLSGLDSLKGALAEATDAEEKKQLQEQLAATQKSIEQAPAIALELLRTALSMVEEDTPQIDREQAQARMAFCYNMLGQYPESVTIGEHLVNRSPNGAATRNAANYAISSLWALHSQVPKGSDHSFEETKLRRISTHVIETWPSDCATAAATMIQLSLTAKDVVSAEKYLGMLSDDANGRASLAISTGYVLWGNYSNGKNALGKALRAGRETEESIKPKMELLNQTKLRAEKYLSEGLSGLDDDVSSNSARASLGLARLYIENSDIDSAIGILENEKYGPLALLSRNDPAVESIANYDINSYRSGLQCYIVQLAKGNNAESANQKAGEMMAQLKQALSRNPRGNELLVGIYVILAKGLKADMESLPADQHKSFAAGLSKFLDKVRMESKDVSALVWVADTYTGLADNFVKLKDEETSSIYKKAAAKVYETIVEVAKDNPDAMSPAVKLEMTRRFAKQKAEAGAFQEAKDLYVELLSSKAGVIEVQVEVAQLMQDWAADTKDANKYAYAMMGTEPRENPKTKKKSNVIWGWGQIGKVVAKYPRYRETFFKARYNLALSRYEYAKLRESKQDRYMGMAEMDIVMTHKTDPSLGGKAWQKKYDTLLREIQKSLGKKANGIKSLE